MNCLNSDKSSDEKSIRDARGRYNAAIANRDADAIAALLASDYHVVTGRSDQSHGVEEQRRRWADFFKNDPALIFHRTPRELRVNAAWGLAEELGDWTGTSTTGSAIVSTAGVYAAKWQRAVDGVWLIQAEVFTTLECSDPANSRLRPEPIGLPPDASLK